MSNICELCNFSSQNVSIKTEKNEFFVKPESKIETWYFCICNRKFIYKILCYKCIDKLIYDLNELLINGFTVEDYENFVKINKKFLSENAKKTFKRIIVKKINKIINKRCLLELSREELFEVAGLIDKLYEISFE